jgi:hypothetical protein
MCCSPGSSEPEGETHYAAPDDSIEHLVDYASRRLTHDRYHGLVIVPTAEHSLEGLPEAPEPVNVS